MGDNKSIDFYFIYCGEDGGFYDSLGQRLKKDYPNKNILHKQFSIKEEKDILSVIKKLTLLGPIDLVFLDCSKNVEFYLKFGKLFLSMITNRKTPVMALLSQDAHEVEFRKIMIRGIKMMHKKGVDLGATTYHALLLARMDWAVSAKFASATNVNDEFSATQYGRVGYISQSEFHIESDMNFTNEEELTIKTFFPPSIKFNRFKVKSKLDDNLYYNFNKAYDLTAIWPEGEDIKLKAQQINELVLNYQKRSLPKQTKILVIDEELAVLGQGQKMIDSYDYSIRFDRCFEPEYLSYFYFLPQIIVYCMKDKVQENEGEDEENQENKNKEKSDESAKGMNLLPNDRATLGGLVQNVKKDQNAPIIIAFNSQLSHLEISNLAYPKLISYKGKFSLETIVQLADKFNSKAASSSAGENPPRYYCDKNNDDSIFLFEHFLCIKEINESTVKFTSPEKIPYYTCFYLKGTIEMNVTVIPVEDDKKMPWAGKKSPYEYFGLINGMGEVERNQLRRYINDILGRRKKEQEKKEREQFEKLNEQMRLKKEKAQQVEQKLEDENPKEGSDEPNGD